MSPNLWPSKWSVKRHSGTPLKTVPDPSSFIGQSPGPKTLQPDLLTVLSTWSQSFEEDTFRSLTDKTLTFWDNDNVLSSVYVIDLFTRTETRLFWKQFNWIYTGLRGARGTQESITWNWNRIFVRIKSSYCLSTQSRLVFVGGIVWYGYIPSTDWHRLVH